MKVKGFVTKKLMITALLGIISVVSSTTTQAQYCDSITPAFNVDLSAQPYMTWVSPAIQRDGFCCGASAPDKCLEFIITLNPNSAAIVFNIASGAVPPGALFYQIDCGTPTPVGSPICLTGVGPFHLTFCKPGNNTNTFSIETIPNPIFGPNLVLGDGCSGLLGVQFYDESTVTWTSVNPGPAGTYNSALSCSSGCDTTSVSNNGSLPSHVDYLVCGMALNGCVLEPVCDTLSVDFTAPLSVVINAPDTVLCANETTVPATAMISGGTAPYTISWSNGSGSASTNVGVGTTSVTITDATGCTSVSSQVTVSQLPALTVNAGNDVNQCSDYIGAITLNGTTNASGVIWSGQGTFTPSNISLTTDYTPTYEEITSGLATITLTTNDVSGCPNVSDNMVIVFNDVYQSVNIQTTDVSCFGLANGAAVVSASGPQAPFTYSFDGGPYSSNNTINSLAPGVHTVAVQSSMGCDSVISFTITQPPVLQVNQTALTNVNCFGMNNGSINCVVNGGTSPYSYNWNTTPIQNSLNASNLAAGSYSLTVTDANSCTVQLNATITQPALLTLNFNTVEPSCFGLSNGAISANVAGGTAPYVYSWNTGSTATSIYSVAAGTYNVTVIDDHGCSITSTEIVNQPTQLTLTTSNDTVVCPGSPQSLVATAAGGTGNYSYSWAPVAGNQSTIIVVPMSNTNYSCIVQDNNGCTAFDTTSIVTFSLDPDDIFATVAPSTICLHDSVNLNGGYNGPDNTVNLTWNFCPTCPVATSDFPTQTTVYTLTGTNQCNQTISANVTATVVQPPVVDLAPNQPSVCENGFFSIQSMNMNTNNTYYWDFGNGFTTTGDNIQYAYDAPGTYTITVYAVNSFGCTSDSNATASIVVNPRAHAYFTTSSFVETTLDPEFIFTNESTDATIFEWNLGDGTNSNSFNVIHSYVDYGTYTITLVANNIYNCPDEYSLNVEVKPEFDIYIPNAFTPDGDANNNIFFAQGFGIMDEGFEFEIYNRWGEQIFFTKDINEGWDGSYRAAEPAQDGVYTWVVRFKDLTGNRHEKNGHVSLLR